VNESREWSFDQDVIASGQMKRIVFIAYEAGEEAGTDECAQVRTFAAEVSWRIILRGPASADKSRIGDR
jgi:hypothetical protein